MMWLIAGRKKVLGFLHELHHANGMSYHVMLPTDELEFHVEGDVRHIILIILGRKLIEHGYPPNAVRVTVAKDGTAIIEQDADIVMAAKQVGLDSCLCYLFLWERFKMKFNTRKLRQIIIEELTKADKDRLKRMISKEVENAKEV